MTNRVIDVRRLLAVKLQAASSTTIESTMTTVLGPLSEITAKMEAGAPATTGKPMTARIDVERKEKFSLRYLGCLLFSWI